MNGKRKPENSGIAAADQGDDGLPLHEASPGMFGRGPESIAVGRLTHATGAKRNGKRRADLVRELAERNGIARQPDAPRPVPETEPGALAEEDGFPVVRRGAIIPQAWIDGGGRRYAVAPTLDGSFVAQTPTGSGGAYYGSFATRPTFEVAQEDLDHLAQLKGWTPATALPAEDDPEPKPVRRGKLEMRHGITVAGDPSAWREALLPAATRHAPPVTRHAPPDAERYIAAVEARAARNEVEHADLDPDSIDPSPFQPRLPESFPAAEIEDLARSIRAEGLLHPILVRPGRSPGRYELIDGERRWRACRLPASGQRTIRAEVQRRTDAEVRRGILVIREQDKPFNAVELARAYRRLVADGDAATDAEAARMIGVAASQFANVTGLLDLPENVQALVISREMTVTQARDLTTYARKVPAIMPALLKKLPKRPAELGTREFQQCLGNALRNLSKPLSGQEPWGKGYDYYEVFKPTPEQREELACVKVPRSYGPPEERATNVSLWNRLQGEQVKRIIEKEEKSGERKAESGKRKSDNRQPTTAEKKAQAKREAQRRAEQARLVARRVWGWKIMRLRAAAAAAFANAAPVVRDQIGLYFLVSASAWSLSTSSEFYRRRGDREELYAKVAGSRGRGEGFPLGAIRERGSAHVAGDATAVVAALLWEEPDGGHTEIPDGDVLGIAEMLAIDLAALWKADQKGDWGREYFELHSKEQLVGLVAEGYPKGGGLFFGVAEKKDKMIRLLQASPKLLPLPKELSRAKGVKNAK